MRRAASINKILLLVIGLALTVPAMADDAAKALLVDMTHTERWNRFGTKMLELHEKRIAGFKIRTTKEVGGYFRNPDFFTEVRYFDSATNRLISKVQWERKRPELVHTMELYFHDQQGRVIRDFGLAYLTDGRAAPMQTTINFHAYPQGLHAFRQFDASNNRIYEHCEGSYRGKKVEIGLTEVDLIDLADMPRSVLTSPEYKACFSTLPTTAGKYLTPQ